MLTVHYTFSNQATSQLKIFFIGISELFEKGAMRLLRAIPRILDYRISLTKVHHLYHFEARGMQSTMVCYKLTILPIHHKK